MYKALTEEYEEGETQSLLSKIWFLKKKEEEEEEEKETTQVTIMQGKVKFILKTFYKRSCCRRASVGNS